MRGVERNLELDFYLALTQGEVWWLVCAGLALLQ